MEVTRLNLTGPPPTSLQLLDIDGAPHLLPLIPADGVLTPLPSKTTPTSNNSGESVTPPASGSPLLRLDLGECGGVVGGDTQSITCYWLYFYSYY